MISSLQELIAPLTYAEFSAILRARTLTFRSGTGENRYAGLLDADSFRRVVESDVIPSQSLLLTTKTHTLDPVLYRNQGKIDTEKLARLLNKGASLIVTALHRFVPALGSLCADIKKHIAEKIRAGAILTTGAGGALVPHYDPEDLIILQMEGAKRWRIWGSPRINPTLEQPLMGTAPEDAPVFDNVVRPGDFLFVPAGYWHKCENGPGHSLHVGIFFEPPSGWNALQVLPRRLLDDELFRAPLSRFGGPAEAAAHEMALKARLIEKISHVSLTELLADDLPVKAVAGRSYEQTA